MVFFGEEWGRGMARLEWFFLAEGARMDPGGVWSALGAGFDRITATALPAVQFLAILGRVSLDQDEDAVDVIYSIKGPDGSFNLEAMIEGAARPNEPSLPDLPRYVTFLAQGQVPLLVTGRYTVTVQVGDGPPHDQSFYVMLTEAAAPTP